MREACSLNARGWEKDGPAREEKARIIRVKTIQTARLDISTGQFPCNGIKEILRRNNIILVEVEVEVEVEVSVVAGVFVMIDIITDKR